MPLLSRRPRARATRSPALGREWLEGALTLLLIAGLMASWATHILVCVMNGLWGFLVIGLVIVPVALLHGLVVLATVWL